MRARSRSQRPGVSREGAKTVDFARANHRIGKQAKDSARSSFVALKKLGAEGEVRNSKLKVPELPEEKVQSQLQAQRFVLCDEQGRALDDFALESGEGEGPQHLTQLKTYFDTILGEGREKGAVLCKADSYDAFSKKPGDDLGTLLLSHIHVEINPAATALGGADKSQQQSLASPTEGKKDLLNICGLELHTREKKLRSELLASQNKFLREVDLRTKKQILGHLLASMPEQYADNIRLLQNSIQIFRDVQNNIVLRPRKRPTPKLAAPRPHRLKTLSSPSGANDTAASGEEETKTRPGGKHTAETEEGDLSRVSLRNYVSRKPATGIKIIHKDYGHLADHEINQAIALLNRFVGLTFRNKDTNYDVETVLKLAKAMKLPLTKKAVNATTFKNSRETVYALKEQLSRYLAAVVNRSNGVAMPESLPKSTQYKFFVGKGNNSIMVRGTLKQRWWWSYGTRHEEGLNLLWTQWYKPKFIAALPVHRSPAPEITSIDPRQQKISNHMERHYHISNKKAMFINLQRYYQIMGEDPFNTLPLTFHIRQGVGDPEFVRFTEYYDQLEEKRKSEGKTAEKNVWIIKPGEYSNRGCGISVMHDFEEIKAFIADTGKRPHTYILQKYIEKPLLISKRKFDIRMYGMLTSINGTIKGYFYEEGYIRTSCKEYSLKNLSNKAIHLTNDAVQQKYDDYGKYEPGNKLSFPDFQKYLDASFPALNIDFYRDLLPQIKVFPSFNPKL